MSSVLTKSYKEESLPFDEKEILRYAGARECEKELLSKLNEAIREVGGRLLYKVCYTEFEVKEGDRSIDLGFTVTESKNLRKNLEGCKKIILFAATVGAEMDRLIRKYSKLSPLKALLFEAIGSERVETVCDVFNSEIKKEYEAKGYLTKPRFSPGYGDLPLELQKDVFSALMPQGRIGVTLNESLLMSPSKSVTAIIGLYSKE